MPPDHPQLLLDHCFSDMSEYGEQLGWDLEFRQLDPGRLTARAAVVANQNIALMRVEFNRRFHQAGQPPCGVMTFGLPDPQANPFRWCGADACGETLLNFNHPGGFEGVSEAGFSGFTISLSEAQVLAQCQVLELDPSLFSRSGVAGHFSVTNEVAQRLRQQMRATLDGASNGFAEGHGVDWFCQSTLSDVLLAASGRHREQAPTLRGPRYRVLRKALDILHDHERVTHDESVVAHAEHTDDEREQ